MRFIEETKNRLMLKGKFDARKVASIFGNLSPKIVN